MSLELNFTKDSQSCPERVSLEDGESLQVFSGQGFQIRNSEIIAQLVPQDKDLQIVCHDGSSYLFKNFLDVDFDIEPQLQLDEGEAITWHNFVQQTEGIEQALQSDDQSNPALAFAPLIVIAASGDSPHLGFAHSEDKVNGESEITSTANPRNEDVSPQQPADEINQASTNDPGRRDSGKSDEDEAIKLSPNGDLSQSLDDEATELTDVDPGFFEIDIQRFIDLGGDGEHNQPIITATVDGQDDNEIEIDPDTGIARVPDDVFEDDNQIDIVVVVDDGNGPDETTITVTETKDGDGAAMRLLLSHDRISENIEGGLIGKLDTDDGGSGREFAYTLSDDSSDLFEIDGNVLKLKEGISIDYEAHPDAYPIRIVAEDATGHRIEQSVDIWPEDVNEVASTQSFGKSGIEDVNVTFNPEDFDAAFDDEDKDYLEMIKVDVLPKNGNLLLGDDPIAAGQLIDYEQIEEVAFKPDENWNGETQFYWSGFDGQAWSSENSPVSISIQSVNDTPIVNVAVGDQITATDQAFSMALPDGSFIDFDLGDTLSYSADLPYWLTIDPDTGAISGDPIDNHIGSHKITITATDNSGESVSQDFSITVENTNDAPTYTQISNTYIKEDATFQLDTSGHFDDADTPFGDTLTFTATLEDGSPLPDWLSFDPRSGNLSGTPSNDDVGTLNLRITASDSEAETSQSFALNVENVNDAPTLVAAIEDQSIDEDSLFELDTSEHFEDVDAGDTLTFTATLEGGSPLPDWISFDSTTGILEGTPRNGDVGAMTVIVTASDGEDSANASFLIDVSNTNDGPVVTSKVLNQTATEDSVFSLEVADNFADEDLGDELSYTATLENGSPLPDWLKLNTATGEFTGTPDNGDVGQIAITVVASDGEAEASDTFSLAVENTNDGPTVVSQIGNTTTDEDSVFALSTASHFEDIDEGDTLSFSATLENGEPLPEWLSIDSETGALTGTPRNDNVRDLRIRIEASDGDASASQAFTLTVENTNDAPHLVSDFDAANAIEDTSFNLNVSNHFEDEDLGDELSYSATQENGDPLPDWLSFDSSSGEFSGTPENEDVGDITITVLASDGEATAEDTFALNVANTNDRPLVVTEIDDQSVNEGSSLDLDVSENFADEDVGDSLSYSATLGNGDPLPNWLSFDSETGEFSGTPDDQDVGSFNVIVTLSDGAETTQDGFSITVNDVNEFDVSAISDTDTAKDAIAEDASAGDSVGIAAFASDDDATNSDVAYSLSEDAADNDVAEDASAGTAVGFVASASDAETEASIDIVVTATSEDASSSQETFAIDVADVNEGPTLVSQLDDQNTSEDSSFNLDVSSNFDDPDTGDTLAYSAELTNESGETIGDGSLPSWLVFESATGQFSGTPENGDVGSFCVTVTATDGLESISDIIGITVENTNDGPVASADANSLSEDTSSVDGNILSNDSDEDAGDTLAVSDVSGGSVGGAKSGSYGNIVINDDGSYTYNLDTSSDAVQSLDDGESLQDAFTYTVSDGNGGTDTATLTIDINGSNDGPTLESAITDQSTEEGNAFSLDISDRFSDIDTSDTLTYSASLTNESGEQIGDGSLPNWLSFDTATGQFSGTPQDGDASEFCVQVTASDGDSATSDIFAIDVDASNPGETVNGSNGKDTITTGDGDDIVDGGNGKDTITTNDGDDFIDGGNGKDTIDAGDGNDTIIGGTGNDDIDAGSGDDTIDATDGYDTVDAGSGDDTITIDYGFGAGDDGSESGSGSGSGSGGEIEFGIFDGGDGDDALVFEGSGLEIDLTAIDSDAITNIETLDIDGNGGNSLKLSADDVLDMTDSENRLFIDGGSDDAVEISDEFQSQGTETVDGVDYTHYYDAGTESHLFINNSITDLDTF